VGGVLPQFSSFIMASLVDNATIGSYRIATNFAILLSFLTFPISTVLFPAFSKINPQEEQNLLKTIFTSSVKYTSILLIPATMLIMVLSQPLVATIYADKWLIAPSFLTFYVVSNIFAIFGNLSLYTLLTGLGETKMLMKLSLLTLSIGVPSALLLIPQFGVFGVIMVTVFAGVPSMSIGLYWIWKKHGTKADLGNSARIFLASILAAVVTFLFITMFDASAWVVLTTGTVLFLAIYLTTAPIFGAINQADIYNLRTMFSSLGVVAKVIEIPLAIMQKMLRVRNVLTSKFSQPQNSI
jgi:O-antigen/teichoic acid export membrane protein